MTTGRINQVTTIRELSPKLPVAKSEISNSCLSDLFSPLQVGSDVKIPRQTSSVIVYGNQTEIRIRADAPQTLPPRPVTPSLWPVFDFS